MNKISYEDAFEALSGLSIGHVSFSSKEYSKYVRDNEDQDILKSGLQNGGDLQRHINKCNDLKTAYVSFVLGDDVDSVKGLQRTVITFFFEVQSKKLTRINGMAKDEYGYVNKLFKKEPSEPSIEEGGRALYYDTFKQVMRTNWDWTPVSKKNYIINKFKSLIKNV